MEHIKMAIYTKLLVLDADTGSVVREYQTTTTYNGRAENLDLGKTALKVGIEQAKRQINNLEVV